jgi:hypothetical protein
MVHPDDERVVVATWDAWAVRDRKSGEILLEAQLDEECGRHGGGWRAV